MKIRKPAYAFLILLLLSIILAACIGFVAFADLHSREDARNKLKLERIEKTLDSLQSDFSDAVKSFINRSESLSDMMVLILREYMKYGQYQGPENFADGFVVRLSGGKLIYPEGREPIPGLSAEKVRDEIDMEEMTFADEKGKNNIYFVKVSKIAGDYYYVDYTPMSEVMDSATSTVRLNETISEIEKSYGCLLFGVYLPDDKQQSSSLDFLIVPDETYTEDLKPEDVGITKELLDEKPQVMVLKDKIYSSSFKEITFFSSKCMMIVLNDFVNDSVYAFNSVLLFASLTIITAMSLILWLYWTQVYVRDHELEPSQVAAYRPKAVRKRSAAVIIVGTIVIFLLALFFESLSNLSRESRADQKALGTMMTRVTDNDEVVSSVQKDEEEWAVYFVERIASVMSDYPIPQTSDFLEKINQYTGSEYVMLFDSEGQEIASSNGVIGYSLVKDEALQPFSRLLRGVGTIVGDPEEGMIYRKKIQYVGTPFVYDDYGAYGAVIMAVDVANAWQNADEHSIHEFITNATPEGNLCVVVDRSDNKIEYSSNTDLIDDFEPDLVLKEGQPEESDLDSYTVDNIRYYGAFKSTEKYVIYYLTETSHVQGHSFLYAFVVAVGYLVITFVVSWYMVHPYSKEVFKANVRKKENSSQREVIELDSLDDFFDMDDNENVLNLKERWKGLIPEQKILLFFQTFLGVLLLVIFVLNLTNWFSYPVNNNSTINFILFGNWKRGFNLLGLAGVLIVIFAYVIYVFFKSILLRILCTVLDPKGETVCRLAFSLIQYGAVLGGVYLMLGFLGFNTTFQLTSVGIVSLAISLGSQDIVADILAGVFIIFEGDFQVGDFVSIDGFTGIVQEIGVRSTKVLGLGDNIKIIGNRSIKNVLNLSKMNTWLTLEFKLPPDVPLLEVEKLLEENLPEIGRRIPEIISGPFYRGVWAVNDFGKKIIHVSCECTEMNSRVITRKLNHEVIVLLESHGYKI